MTSDASKDQNDVSTLLGVSNADGTTPVKIWASPSTHRLLVDTSGGGGTPGSPVNSIQYNNAGSFGGSSTLLFNGTDTITTGTEGATFNILGADATTNNTAGASLSVTMGDGLGSEEGGTITLQGGAGGTSGGGGEVQISAGNAGGGNKAGGDVSFAGGNSTGSGDGGGITFHGGVGGDTGVGGEIQITAGTGGATSGAGGDVDIRAGNADAGSSNGGNITLTPGSKTGGGTQGNFFVTTLDTDNTPPTTTGTTRFLISDSTGLISFTSSTGTSFSDNETPSGTINGVNTTFSLAHTPSPAASLMLFLNGAFQAAAGVDYTLATATITFVSAPLTSGVLRAFYRY